MRRDRLGRYLLSDAAVSEIEQDDAREPAGQVYLDSRGEAQRLTDNHPSPRLLQLGGERERVSDAKQVESCTRGD